MKPFVNHTNHLGPAQYQIGVIGPDFLTTAFGYARSCIPAYDSLTRKIRPEYSLLSKDAVGRIRQDTAADENFLRNTSQQGGDVGKTNRVIGLHEILIASRHEGFWCSKLKSFAQTLRLASRLGNLSGQHSDLFESIVGQPTISAFPLHQEFP